MAAPTQLAFRTLKGIGIFDAAPLYENVSDFERPEGNLRCCAYSPDGRFFAWASPEKVSVVDPSVGHLITTLPAQNVFELGFSPLGTYIITWQRHAKDEDGNATKNLKVWKTVLTEALEERSVVGEFVQKSQSGWNLQYTSDEAYCARVVTNEVQFYRSDNLSTVWNKLRVEGVTDFMIAPGKNHTVAVFVPERKGQPATVKMFGIPDFAAPVSQKTFFKGDKVQFKWNDLGTSLIVLAQTEVDKSNKSYYGETNMYIMSANGGFDSRVQLDKEGPIHDVSWSPNSKEFGVVYGYMPAKATIFNSRAVVVHHFPLGPRNTILFSPHGRFVLVAGFGNLAGQMDIYDLQKDYVKVATVEASNASVCEWSPDGRHILTATTSPRLRVDNGIRIWHIGGSLMYNQDMTELYQVFWRPQSTTQHPLDDPFSSPPTPHSSSVEYLSRVKAPSKSTGAYRPPGARGTETPLHFKREDEGGAAFINNGISSTSGGLNGFGRNRRREVPGAEVAEHVPPGAAPGGGVSLSGAVEGGDDSLSKTAQKNKKKREAKRAKEAADKGASLGAPASNGGESSTAPDRSPDRRGGRGHERSRSKGSFGPRPHSQRREGSRARGGPPFSHNPHHHQHHHHRSHSQTIPSSNGMHHAASYGATEAERSSRQSAMTLEITLNEPLEVSPMDKKIRSLLKKIRAIEDLKMRQAGGEKLEDTQIKKIATEDSIRKELEALGFHG